VAATARQAPVAEDLRLMLSLIEVAQRASLIANQFELISEQFYELDPDARDPQQTAGQLSLMTELAGRQVQHSVRAFVTVTPSPRSSCNTRTTRWSGSTVKSSKQRTPSTATT
jgi:phosphate uptake regulator